jgi:O-antigen/teichoic acid export membrane protein
VRILKDSVIYLSGELLAKSLPFLMLPYLTRKLGTEGFGELSFYLTMLSLFGIVIGMSQEGAVTRYFYFYGKRGLHNIIKVGYLYNLVISLALLLACWIFNAEILAYIVIATTFQSFLNVMLATQQCQKKPWSYISIQLLLSLSNVIYTVLALEWFYTEQVRNRILAIVLANATTFLIVILFNKKLIQLSKTISWLRLKQSSLYIFSFGLPLILHQSSFFIKGQLDRIFIYQKFSAGELGIYSAGVQIASVLPIIFMALNKAMVPYYYENLKAKKLTTDKIKRYVLYSIPICILPSALAFFTPNSVYTWFLGSNFGSSHYYVGFYLLGFGLNLPYLLLVNYFFYHGKNTLISKLTISSSFLYLILLILLTQLSLRDVPFALLVSNIILIILLWRNLKNV